MSVAVDTAVAAVAVVAASAGMGVQEGVQKVGCLVLEPAAA